MAYLGRCYRQRRHDLVLAGLARLKRGVQGGRRFLCYLALSYYEVQSSRAKIQLKEVLRSVDREK